jgi:hypothetical protein
MGITMADKYPSDADIEVLKKLGLPVPGATTTKKDEE